MKKCNASVDVYDQSADGVMAASRKLRKAIGASGTHAALKRHSYYMKPGERRRLKAKIARRKERKRRGIPLAVYFRELDRTGRTEPSERTPSGRGTLPRAAWSDPRRVAAPADARQPSPLSRAAG